MVVMIWLCSVLILVILLLPLLRVLIIIELLMTLANLKQLICWQILWLMKKDIYFEKTFNCWWLYIVDDYMLHKVLDKIKEIMIDTGDKLSDTAFKKCCDINSMHHKRWWYNLSTNMLWRSISSIKNSSIVTF